MLAANLVKNTTYLFERPSFWGTVIYIAYHSLMNNNISNNYLIVIQTVFKFSGGFHFYDADYSESDVVRESIWKWDNFIEVNNYVAIGDIYNKCGK